MLFRTHTRSSGSPIASLKSSFSDCQTDCLFQLGGLNFCQTTFAEMSDDVFLGTWLPIETRLRGVEDTYRIERIRENGHPYPEEEQVVDVMNDLRAAVELYLSATAEQRSVMRGFFSWSYLLPSYLGRNIHLSDEQSTHEAFIHSLRLVLAAVSLEDNQSDYRDTYCILGDFWRAVYRRQIDPQPYFCEAAAWSSDKDEAGRGSMRRFLLGFHESAFFKADVAPRLEQRG